jgi:hypothetical protein
LGVFPSFLGHFVWALLRANAWGVEGLPSMWPELGVTQLRAELWAWYKSESRASRNHTRLQNLTLSMLGTASEPDLRLHAAETNSFLEFCSAMFPHRAAALGASAAVWKRGLDSLMALLQVVRLPGPRIPASEIQRYCDAAVTHHRALGELGLRKRPKHHLMLHIGPRLDTK